MKKKDKIYTILIFILIAVQFFVPFINVNGEYLSAFSSLKYNGLNGFFNYSLYILVFSILSLTFLLLPYYKWFDKHYQFMGIALMIVLFSSFLFSLGSLIFFLPGSPLLSYSSFGIKLIIIDEIVSVIIFGYLLIFSSSSLVTRTFRDWNQTHPEELIITTKDFERAIKNKKILYENTVLVNMTLGNLLNPSTKPNTSKLVVTTDEILISTRKLIRIKFSQIDKIYFTFLSSPRFIIKLKNGSKYTIIWASIRNKSSFQYSYNGMFLDPNTRAIFNSLRRLTKL
ncbi:MAG: hypothetical protein WC796_02055 [Candidatus Pacearchaeota archaeon]|jgi:hypothetical protein